MKKEFALLYTFSYMALGSFTPLIGQYFDSIGMDGEEIGTVTSLGTLVAAFAIAIWGRIYNGSYKKAGIIEMLCLGAICLNLNLSLCKSFFPIILFYGVMYFFQAPILSLVDSYTIMGEDRSFGGKRAWGAVGFAAGVFLAGEFSEMAGLKSIFVIYQISYVITIIALALIYNRLKKRNISYGPEKKTDKMKTYKDLLRSNKLIRLFICIFFIGGTNVANNTYFSFLYISGGGTVAGVGICMFLMVGSEIPFMALSRRISERFSIEKVLFAAMCISVARFLAFGLGLPWWMLFIMFFTQGMVNGIILVEAVRCVSAYAPEGCSSLAISAYYIISGSISVIICQYSGGLLLEWGGATSVYLFFGIFNLVGVILFACFGFLKKK